LRYGRATDNYVVAVNFARENGFAQDVDERLKANLGERAIPIRDSFSDDAMRGRERQILERIRGAFALVIPGDVLDFTLVAALPTDRASLVVDYAVGPGDGFYFREDDEHIPANRRPLFMGIEMDWKLTLSVPDGSSKAFSFRLASSPADNITYQAPSVQEASAARASIYDSMAASAFDDFGAVATKKFGVGQ